MIILCLNRGREEAEQVGIQTGYAVEKSHVFITRLFDYDLPDPGFAFPGIDHPIVTLEV